MVIIEGLETRKALYLTVQSIDILSEISWYLKIFCKEPCPFNQPPSPSSNCQLSCGHRSLQLCKALGPWAFTRMGHVLSSATQMPFFWERAGPWALLELGLVLSPPCMGLILVKPMVSGFFTLKRVVQISHLDQRFVHTRLREIWGPL